MSEKTVRKIKKYPNRRIYDTRDSKYITIHDVRDMVVEGEEFLIVDAKTDEDITRSVLLQIIIEQESETNPLFTSDNLRNFIRYYGASQQQGFSDFINQSLNFFQQQQDQFRSNVSEMIEQSPVKVWSDISKQNMEMWQQMQGAFFGGAGSGNGSSTKQRASSASRSKTAGTKKKQKKKKKKA